MIIISHDRHFLNQVCTHVADMDYGTLKIYPGNYDDYMFASTQARNQQLANNAKAKDKVAELQEFVRRFAANKSKARQATSRAKQIEKIKVDDIKPSSRAIRSCVSTAKEIAPPGRGSREHLERF